MLTPEELEKLEREEREKKEVNEEWKMLAVSVATLIIGTIFIYLLIRWTVEALQWAST